jgi:O-antigen ligase
MQTAGEDGLLLGGRSEFLVSSLAVLESPVIGHGSWAKDCRYASLYVELKREAGYIPGAESETCLIPAHSHFMGAWVQAGVFGAVFWLWVLTLPVRTLARLYATRERLTPLVAFLAFLLLWDIFFSPFGGDRRFMTPFYIVLMMSYLPAGTKRWPVTPGAPAQLAANPL